MKTSLRYAAIFVVLSVALFLVFSITSTYHFHERIPPNPVFKAIRHLVSVVKTTNSAQLSACPTTNCHSSSVVCSCKLKPTHAATPAATVAKYSSFKVINAKQTYKRCDQLEIGIEARDSINRPKSTGGDYFWVWIHNDKLNASSAADEIVDHNNGSYTALVTLYWEGAVEINVTLVHSSEAINILRRVRDNNTTPRNAYQGTFQIDGNRVKKPCHISTNMFIYDYPHDANKSLTFCNYTDSKSGFPGIVSNQTIFHAIHIPSIQGNLMITRKLQRLFINDLPSCVSAGTKTRLFADDAFIYREINSVEDQIILQTDLDAISRWSQDWQMTFHTDKCFKMNFTTKKTIKTSPYTLCQKTLEAIYSHPYLGFVTIYVGKSISLKSHIAARRNFKACPTYIKSRLYLSLIEERHQLDMIQRSAARLCYNNYSREASVTQMLNQLEWPSLDTCRLITRLSLILREIRETSTSPTTSVYVKRVTNRQSSTPSTCLKHPPPRCVPGLPPRSKEQYIFVIFVPWFSFSTGMAKVADIDYVANRLDKLKGGPDSVIFISMWAHFWILDLQFYRDRLRSVKDALTRLQHRTPGTRVFFKSPNTYAGAGRFWGFDIWYATEMDRALREEIVGFPDVTVIDVWDMTIGHRTGLNIHPQEIVVGQEVSMFLSFLCTDNK
ncbi:NXPE family member 3-like [Amphiura filiformis]|uniref:NXPE family member 3-like n=1 Tax=Amphiura filiformis TaxID=82378 RepID=UPI003B21ABA5